MPIEKATCTLCTSYCPVNVAVEAGTILRVEGDPDAPLYEGFICPKGRAITDLHYKMDRLKHHLKRMPDGTFREISTEQLVDDISSKLKAILDRHGPGSVAAFVGSPVVEQQAAAAMLTSFMTTIGSRNIFSTNTIDQPGHGFSRALHGDWAGGYSHPDVLDAMLLVGTNPIISKQYLSQNPGVALKQRTRSGMKLIVIDPRRTESARRAQVFLQCIPGEDPTILAGLVHLIIREGAVDKAFVEQNAEGLEQLTTAVAPFTPAYVAERAGVNEVDLREAARLLAQARRGAVNAGVGPSMSTRGTLACYLGRCLQTLRGFWPGAGEKAYRSSVLTPRRHYKAQPTAPIPAWGFGKQMRVRGLQETVSGMPVAALPEEILTPGEGQIRALFLHSGSMLTWPQAQLAREALESLELLVVHDVERKLSPTARAATHVIATTIPLEFPVMSQFGEVLNLLHHGYGRPEPYATYHPALVRRPADADILEPWQIYFRVAQKLALALSFRGLVDDPRSAVTLDMEREPTTHELYELMCRGSVIPLAEVARYPSGKVFEEATTYVEPRDPDCTARLQLADPTMMAQLHVVGTESYVARRGITDDYPFLLVTRRVQNTTNSAYRADGLLKRPYNPAYLHSSDLERLGLIPGDAVQIRSRRGAIVSFVDVDDHLRRGVLSICHGFGGYSGDVDDPYRNGSNINELLHWEDDFDPYHGMPRMSAVPVSIIKVDLLRRGEQPRAHTIEQLESQ